MGKFSPKMLGDMVQIAASIGVLAGLGLLIVDIAQMQRTTRSDRMDNRPAPVEHKAPAPVIVSEARQSELKTFLRVNCSLCHGTEGSLGPLLSSPNLQHLSAEAIALTILHGRPAKGMPAWDLQLSEAEAHWIAGYLKRAGFAR